MSIFSRINGPIKLLRIQQLMNQKKRTDQLIHRKDEDVVELERRFCRIFFVLFLHFGLFLLSFHNKLLNYDAFYRNASLNRYKLIRDSAIETIIACNCFF